MAETKAPASWKLLAHTQIASVRQIGDGDEARRAVAELGMPWPSQPLRVAGNGSCRMVWRSPQETLAVARGREDLQPLLLRLAPGREVCAVAVDLSEALAVLELEATVLDAWLARLVDATSIPREPQQASRARLADVAVMLLRLDAQRLWLVADRPLLPYLDEWLAHARDGALGAASDEEETA